MFFRRNAIKGSTKPAARTSTRRELNLLSDDDGGLKLPTGDTSTESSIRTSQVGFEPTDDDGGGRKLIVGGGDGDNTVGGNTGGGLEDVFTPEGSCEYTTALRDRKKARLLDLQAQLAECNARHNELDLALGLNSEMQTASEVKKKRNMGLALGAAATVGLGYTYYKTRGV